MKILNNIFKFIKKDNNGIIKIDSGVDGPTLAIFCGVHGNERAGINAVKKALKEVRIKKGIVYFVFANQKAIGENKRFIEKNLNRCFLPDQNGNSYEEKRAKELLEILDKADALLDIHSSSSPETEPFIITEEKAFSVIDKMNFNIVVTNIDEVEKGGSDGYMNNAGKIGICLECGYLGDAENNNNLAFDSILKFLKFYNVIEDEIDDTKIPKKVLRLDGVQMVTNESFKRTKEFADFETVPKNEIIATDNEKKYFFEEEKVILFGSGETKVGEEAYLVGKWVNNN